MELCQPKEAAKIKWNYNWLNLLPHGKFHEEMLQRKEMQRKGKQSKYSECPVLVFCWNMIVLFHFFSLFTRKFKPISNENDVRYSNYATIAFKSNKNTHTNRLTFAKTKRKFLFSSLFHLYRFILLTNERCLMMLVESIAGNDMSRHEQQNIPPSETQKQQMKNK